MSMFDHLAVLMTVIFAGFLLIGVGFTNRDKNWGVALIAIGAATMMVPVAYKIFMTFG
ncbi:MAG: hypothetical protein ABID63_11325 [Pseudomonadota bacterium]